VYKGVRMKVVVTGGAGYIGAVTSDLLLQQGHDVVIIDDLRTGHRDLVPDGATFLQADVAEPRSYASALEGMQACLHFAASAEAGISMQRPEVFYANNTAATLRLLDALIGAGVDRFVLSSTCAVYGEPDAVPIREDDRKQPTNVYGHSKLLVERALPWLAELRGLRYAALRYFNAAGATEDRGEDHARETHVIPLVLQAAAGLRDDVAVLGTDYPTPDGTCVRDYVHVADLADAHVRALNALDVRERVVCNLGTETGFSVREVIDTAREVTGRPIRLREAQRRPGDPATLVASAATAREVLGWRPRHTELADIVTSAWRWHRRRWRIDG
jgi:UDP-glucose 4-epimerase